MHYVINVLIYFSLYISIPLAIRYVILRKPIKSKWVTIGILIPIFIGFSIIINIQRDEAQKNIYQKLNLPYKSRPHMLGSPTLDIAMILSYIILRRRNRKSEGLKNEVLIDADTVMKKKSCNIEEQALGKVEKKEFSQENKTQDISKYENSSSTKKDKTGGNFTKFAEIFIIAIIILLTVFVIFDKAKVSDNERTVTESTNSLKDKQEAAEQGDADAQNEMGFIYYMGLDGVPQDYKEAVKWYTKSAEQGNASAQYYLGKLYEDGNGVPQDYKEAVKWYTKSAEQGDQAAQATLGYLYETGKGVSKNIVEAYKWFNLAAANGAELSKYSRDELTKIMTPKQIADGQRLSREFTQKIQK